MNFTIVNWNINRALPGSDRTKKLRAQCEQFDADIFVLTETHGSFCPREGYLGVHSGTPDYAHADGERMCSIWSKTPIGSLNEYLQDPARCTAGRIALADNRHIVVLAIVLPWVGDAWQGHSSRDGNAFLKALHIYREDGRNLRDRFPRDGFILAGDFNQDLITEHYYGSKDQKRILRDALLSDDLVPLTADGDDPVYRDSPPHACIDHICINRHSGFTPDATTRWPEAEAPDTTLSDHFGIAVKLK